MFFTVELYYRMLYYVSILHHGVFHIEATGVTF